MISLQRTCSECTCFVVLLSTVAIATASILPAGPLPYYLYRGWTFYLQMVVIALEFLLTLVATYDFVISRRLGGDPTFYSRDPSGSGALTYSNPSFKDEAGRGVAGQRNGSSSITSLNSTVSGGSIRSNGKHVPGSRLQLARQISAQNKSPSGRTSPRRSRSRKWRPSVFRLFKRNRRSPSLLGALYSRGNGKHEPIAHDLTNLRINLKLGNIWLEVCPVTSTAESLKSLMFI